MWTGGGPRPGACGAAWLADGSDVGCHPGEGAVGTYLSLGPTCRCGCSQYFWALALLAPWAMVGSGGDRPGRGSSGAGCTWGSLCRTRPPTSSRPGGGDICSEHRMQSSPPCTLLPAGPASQKALKRPLHSSGLPLPLETLSRATRGQGKSWAGHGLALTMVLESFSGCDYLCGGHRRDPGV